MAWGESARHFLLTINPLVPKEHRRDNFDSNYRTVTAGAVKPFAITAPDGSAAPFNIPKGFVFVITDISMQRLSVSGTAGLFDFSIQQTVSKNGTVSRWTFIGKVAQNVERTFNDGIVFSTAPTVENGSQSVDTIIVRAWGHFAAQF